MDSFPNLQPVHCFMSSSKFCFLTCIQISPEADKVVWYSHLLKNFPQFVVTHTVKVFGIVNKAVVDVLWMWELDYKESWVPKNWYFWTVVGENSWESLGLQGDQTAHIQWNIEKAREFQKNICFTGYTKAFDCVDQNKLWKILQEMGIPDHLICLLRNLYAGQEATVRTGHGTTDWFQINWERNRSRLYIVTLLI